MTLARGGVGMEDDFSRGIGACYEDVDGREYGHINMRILCICGGGSCM